MQENWPVAGSSDSMLSINPGCAWIRGKNSLLRAALNSPTLARSIVQLTMREYMVASLKCLPRWMQSGTTLAPPGMGGQEQPGVSSHTLRSRMRSRSAQRLEDCERLEHSGPILPQREFLRAPARPQSQVPHLRENARHLHPIQLRDEWQQFRDKLIFYQVADFFLAIAFAT